MFTRFCFGTFIYFAFLVSVDAAQCSATFADGLTNSHTNGKIKFEDTAQLLNNPDTILATTDVDDNSSNGSDSCDTDDCTASGSTVPALSASYVDNASNTNLTVNGNSQTITTNRYKDIKVESGGHLTMDSTVSTYYFRRLKLESDSTVSLTKGDYYVEEIELKGRSELIVIDSGPVRIFVKKKAKFKEDSIVNGGVSGDPSQLIVYFFAEQDDQIKVDSGTTYAGYIYSEKKVEIKGNDSRVKGAISSEGELKLEDDAKVTYADLEPDFGDLCGEIEVVAGRITLNNTADNPSFTHVCFDTPFSVAPVVFSLPTTASNSDRLALRISNVTENGFDIAQVESPEKANPSAPAGNIAQTVDFLAIVEGDYDLDGGAKMRVSTLGTKKYQAKHIGGSSWDTVDITDLGFSQPPAIIASIQTMNNEPNVNNPDGPFPISEPFLVTAMKSVTKTQFNMALERAETNTGTIASNETIGYLAITQGVIGQLTDDISYESFQTGNNITGLNSCRIFNLAGSYSDNPLIIATQNTRYGGDGGWLKRCSISSSNVGFSIVEDSDRDTDTGHTNERAGGLALDGTFKDFTNNCGDPIIDHYEIEHDGSGLTCEAESIIIKACADADCNTLNLDATDVELAINGTVNKTVTVVGSTETSFSYTTTGTAILSLDQPYECKNGNSASCDVIFADTGFRFFSDTEGTGIPEQLSAKPSNIGFNSSTLKVQAIKKNPETGACQAAFIDSNTIEMVATCVDPTVCASSQVTINNLSANTPIDTLNNAASKTYTGVALDFSNEAVNSAEFIFTYPDAGKVQLHARYNIRDENGDPTGNYMLGSSSAFVVRPLGFYINVDGNPKAQSANQVNSAFKKAGDDFTTSLTAVQWQAVDDSDGNGIPDTGADLSDNITTVNFGNEATSENAIITDSLYLPNPGTEGVLTNVNFTDFSNGVATNGVNNGKSMTYDEVGIVNFTANLTDGTYLGVSDITGVEPYVGRFIPHHFELTGFDGEFKSTCDITTPSSEMTFAYIGQMSSSSSGKGALQYIFQPEVTITPQNKLNIHTQNYTGDFNKLLLSGINRFEVDDGTGSLVLAPIEDFVKKGVDDTNKVKLTANFSDAILSETGGVLSFEYSIEDNFVYTHEQNSEIIPFIADINLSIASVIDEDGVTADDADDDGDTGVATDTVITLNPEGKEVRFGRAYLANSFGPETSNLPQPLFMQYLNTVGNYVTNEQDTCTDFNASQIKITSGTLDEIHTSVNTAMGQFDDDLPDGETRSMFLIAPGLGNQGTIEVEYTIYDWLKYDWDWNGVDAKLFDENPTATATFGLFRGNDRIIYIREIF